MTWDHYLVKVSVYSAALPLLAALLTAKQSYKKGFLLLTVFLLFNAFEEFIMTYLAMNGIENWWFLYMAFPVHFFFVAFILRHFEITLRKEFKIITWLVTIQICVLHFIYLMNKDYGTIGLLFGSITLSGLAARVLISNSEMLKPFYFFTIAVFIYYFITSISFFALNSFTELYPIPFFINSGTNIISNLIMAWGIWTVRQWKDRQR
jgi:hypothetical protein